MRYLKILPALCLVFVNYACHHDPDSVDVKALLTSGLWTMSSDLLDKNSTGVFSEQIEDCQKDNTFLFKADGTLEIRENANVCDPDFPFNADLNWELRNTDTELAWVFSVDELNYKVYSIDPNKMVLHAFDPAKPNEAVWEKITFVR